LTPSNIRILKSRNTFCAKIVFDPTCSFVELQAQPTLAEFEQILGTFDRTHSAKFATYYWWDDLGIQAHQEADKNDVGELTFAFNSDYRDTRNWTSEYGPHNPFTGHLEFGELIVSSETNATELKSHEFRYALSQREDILRRNDLGNSPIVVFLSNDMLISTLSVGLEPTNAG
jgi:hypothetical protein